MRQMIAHSLLSLSFVQLISNSETWYSRDRETTDQIFTFHGDAPKSGYCDYSAHCFNH